jgi:hypothetical protein
MAALLLALLSGCAHTPAQLPPVPKVVAECPEPRQIVRPRLPISDLTPEKMKGLSQSQVVEEIIRSGTMSMEILIGYAEELEAIINGYRKP